MKILKMVFKPRLEHVVLLCILHVCIGKPTMQYLVATDPRNNQVYIPAVRFMSDLFRNSIWDYNKILENGPGFPPNPNSNGQQAMGFMGQGVHSLENAASLPFSVGKNIFDGLTSSGNVVSGLNVPQFIKLQDGSVVQLTPHPTLPGQVITTMPTGQATTINAKNLGGLVGTQQSNPPNSLSALPVGFTQTQAGVADPAAAQTSLQAAQATPTPLPNPSLIPSTTNAANLGTTLSPNLPTPPALATAATPK